MKITDIPHTLIFLFRGLPALLLAAFIITTAPEARAAVVATDNFDSYTVGTTVVGGVSGTGWTAAWTGQNDYVTVVGGSNSITYTLDNGEVRGGGNALKITAPSTSENIGVLERAVPEITDGGDVFVSLIFKIKSGTDTDVDHYDGETFTTNNNIYYLAGDGDKSPTHDASGFAGYKGMAGARLAGGWVSINNKNEGKADGLIVGQTYFLVIRYSGWNTGYQGYDTITTWLNPATTDEGVGTKSGNNTSNDKTKAITREGNTSPYGSSKFSSLYLNTLGLNSSSRFHIIDDIRVGRNWADVVGIPMPVVNTITPSSVMAGNTIVVAGKYLADVTVTIGGVDAVINSQTDTTMTVVVPPSLGMGTQDVVITGPGGTTTKSLTVIRPPIINSATPDTGAGGDTVTIEGLNLEDVVVTIGGIRAAVVSQTGTTVVITVPRGLANGAQTITVTSNAGEDTIAFTNTSPTPPAPDASGINPVDSRTGATVTISGSNLVGAYSVTVGGVEAEITSRTDDAITIVIPGGLANGEYPVVITTAGGETCTTVTLTDVIATDNFDDYAAGDMLAGASGGRGWSGAWAANAGVTVTDSPDDIITYTMSDGTVLGGGKALKLAADTPVSATLPRLLERDLAQPVTSGEDVFVSFIFKIKNPNAPDGELVPAGDNVTSIWYAKDSDPNLRFDSLGYIGYSGKVGASMAAPTGAALVSTQLKTGRTYFAVVRYSGWDGSSYKKCRVWLNPATNDEPAVSTTITNERTVTTAGVGSDSFLGLCVGGYGITSGGRYQVIDDIRVGYTWTAVTNPRTTFIASEDFDSYAPGSKLAGAAGGTGWDGPWSAQNAATIIDDPADAVTYTLNDGTVRGGGSALKISGTGVNAAATVAAVLERRFARVPEGEDVYGSFVFKIKNPALPDGTPLVGNTCALWYAADAAKDELRDIAAFAGYGGKAGGRLAGGWPTVTTPLVAGQSYLLVFRYSGWNDGIQAYDNCRVWLNPTTDDEASTDAAITVERAGNSAGYGNTDIRGLYVNTLGLTLNGAYHVVDDIRVGTDWATVVGEPAPAFEPGTPPQLNALPAGEFVAGDTITLAGNNFTGLTRVLIGGVEALVTASTDTTITVVIPENAAGGAVAVFTTSGCSIAADSLTIATQPSFVTNPAATQVAVEGRPVDLTADVWAHGAISYEWQYRANDTAVWETVPGSISVGADTNELSLLMPDGKNGWQFRCVASTAAGSVEGTPVTLTVIENLLDAPAGLVTGSGDYSQFVYVSDRAAHTVSVLSPNGSFALLAGKTGYSGNSDGNGDEARFTRPRGLAFSSTNSLIVADYGNGPLRSIALDTAAVQTLNATGPDAWLASPAAVATDAAGMTYIADTGNQLIKRLNADGVMEIFAGSAISGTDNGALLDAKFKNPAGLAVSTSGSRIYVADTGNHVIRLIDLSTGQVSTFAGQMASPGAVDGAALSTASFDSPTGIVLDSSGDLYVADSGNSRIRVITTNTTGAAEAVVTLAGSVPGFRDGPGKTAWFDAPEALAIGADGVLYVADTGNGIIRRIDTSADAIVSTPAMKTVTYPPSGGTDSDGDNGSGGGGGGGSTSIWFLLALAASAALRGRKK